MTKATRPGNRNVAFVQNNSKDQSDDDWKKNVQCYKCKTYGHYKNECQGTQRNVQNFNCNDYMMNQKDTLEEDMCHWVLLDN